MKKRCKVCFLLSTLSLQTSLQALELTGRVSLLGTAVWPGKGDAAYAESGNDTLTADQQSLRLMLDHFSDNTESSVHLKTVRQNFDGLSAGRHHSSELFRYRDLSDDWLQQNKSSRSTRMGYEVDRLVYKHQLKKNITLSLGRQPIDWGAGRFWQPLNVFGAFAPTDLDTDYKPGIDTAIFNWYPSAFSSLTSVYAFSPKNDNSIEESGALYYRRPFNDKVEISMLAGQINGNTISGASVETDWAGMGLRFEGAHYDYKDQTKNNSIFWIAGVDYQFSDGTLLTLEWYDNSNGTNRETGLSEKQSDELVTYGLQPYLGRNVLGASLDRDVTPLLHVSYMVLISGLKDTNNKQKTSLLHQINLVYSLSNESDLLFSVIVANGKGLNQQDDPVSEFGHVPSSITLRYRHYF